MSRSLSPWMVAALSAFASVGFALRSAPLGSKWDSSEVLRATSSPERAATAFAEALATDRRELAMQLSTGAARHAVSAGPSLRPLPEAEIAIDGLQRLPGGRTELLATSLGLDADAGLSERTLRFVLQAKDGRYTVEELSFVDGQ